MRVALPKFGRTHSGEVIGLDSVWYVLSALRKSLTCLFNLLELFYLGSWWIGTRRRVGVLELNKKVC